MMPICMAFTMGPLGISNGLLMNTLIRRVTRSCDNNIVGFYVEMFIIQIILWILRLQTE